MSQLHNEIRRAGALLRGIRNALGLTEEPGVERLGETLTPTFDAWRPEFAFLRGVKLVQGFAAEGADVANFSGVQLENPATSGALIHVRRILILVASTASYNLDHSTTQLSTIQTGQSQVRDTRWLGSNFQGVVRHGVFAAVFGLPTAQWRGLAGTTIEEKVDYILKPGDTIIIRGAAINTAVNATFSWEERTPLPTELIG